MEDKQKLKENAIKEIEKALKKILPFKILCDKNKLKLSDAATAITDFVKQNPNVTEEEFKNLCNEIDNLNRKNIKELAEKIVSLKLKGSEI